MPDPGVDVLVVDEFLGGEEALATDTMFLFAAAGPAVAVKKVRADDADATINNYLRAYFTEGGRSVYLQGYGDGSTKPTLANAIAALPAGPGQIVAPEAVTSADQIIIANAAWPKKVYFANGPTTATVAQLQTLRTTVTAGATAGGRGYGLFAGTGAYPGATAGASNVDVVWPVAVAGMVARNDRVLRNPNIAPAGRRGVSRAFGITQVGANSATIYTPTEIETLKNSQINAARVINGQIRNYGFRTGANLGTLPHWWDLSGSRTIMAFYARAGVIGEEIVFDQIDGDRVLLDRFEGLLRSACKDLFDLRALYGKTPAEAYTVLTDETVNPLVEIADGDVSAVVRLKISPFAEHVTVEIVRRALTSAEL